MTKQESNIMKGLAIILMYIHHLFYDEGSFSGYDIDFGLIGMKKTIQLAQLSKVCVAIFVFVTAYGITKQYMEKGISSPKEMMKYSTKKYLKLMFGFWFILFLAILTSTIMCAHTWQEVYGTNNMSIYYFILDFLGMAYRFDSPTYNATWWYLTFAIVLIFLMPIFIKMYDSFGLLMIPFAFFAPIFINANDNIDSVFSWYFMGIVFAVVFAKDNFLENIKIAVTKSGKIVLLLSSILLGMGLSWLRLKAIWRVSAIDNLLVLCIVFINILFISKLPVVNRILEKLGTYSMNLFLTHTFIKSYFLREFTYSWKYPLLILLVFLVDTFFLAFLIEFLKKIVNFKYLENQAIKLTDKIIDIL